MPLKSKAQARLMYATISGYNTGIPKKVAKEYIKNTPKSRFKKLKEYLKKGNKKNG